MVMDDKLFPGRQTDEKTLYFTRSHPIAKYAFVTKSIFFSLILFLAFFFLADYFFSLSAIFRLFGIVIPIAVVIFAWGWGNSIYAGTAVYITDRRIVKFAAVAPFLRRTRALFWDEAVKCKTYRKHPLLDRFMGIGSIEIEARTDDKDNINIDGIIYHDDLANYIDKILFTYKNKPNELTDFKPFVARPKGQRD